MTQYNALNVKLSNLQLCNLQKLKSGIKNGTEITLKLSSNVFGDSNDGNNFPDKFLLTNTQVSNLRQVSKLRYYTIIKNSFAEKRTIRTILGPLLD